MGGDATLGKQKDGDSSEQGVLQLDKLCLLGREWVNMVVLFAWSMNGTAVGHCTRSKQRAPVRYP